MSFTGLLQNLRRLPLSAGLAGALLVAPVLAEEEWPREIEAEGALVVLYQPQLESFEQNQLRARAAVSVQLPDNPAPVFGTVWIDARVDTDLDTRLVSLRSLSIPRVRIAEATEANLARLASLLEEQLPATDIELSLDRLLASVEALEQRSEQPVEFDNTPPTILFARTPTVLVSLDGPPKFWPIEGSSLQSVVNSPFVLLQDREAAVFYLYAGEQLWYRSNGLRGDWSVAAEVPGEVRAQQPAEPEQALDTPPEGETRAEDDLPPAILVVGEPTELIVTAGAPSYKPLGEQGLLYVDNTDSDLLLDTESQRHFLLLAGRWFWASSLEGPWSFVAADALPASFAAIPEDSEMGHSLAWVAGTELAAEVAADAYVPQTSAIRRDATIEVTYDGTPRFEDIEGTSLKSALNTQSQVIQAGATYYCAHEGVWYVAESAQGPWVVATEVPDEFQDIPPSSQVYNTKYVYVFDSTPEVVYVGYYPGYTGCYSYHGCLVYGTGWYYPPYYRPGYYYPRHGTWGFHVGYNPYTGWNFGLSWSNGPFTFTLGRGGVNGWFGPVGAYGYRGAYARGYARGWQEGFRAGERAADRVGNRAGDRLSQRPRTQNLYNQRDNRTRNASRDTAARLGGADGPGRARDRQAPATRVGGAASGPAGSRVQPTRAAALQNNVFADRDGNVHRRSSDGSWQTRDGGNWGAEGRAAATRPTTSRPTTQPVARPQVSSRQSLERSHQTRQRGTQRTQASRSSLGGARGGGGRRR